MIALRRRAVLTGAVTGAVTGALALAGHAARAQPAGTSPRPSLPATRTTQHVLDLPGRSLRFSATAGAVTLGDGVAPAQAAVAYVAYRLEGADPARRPVTMPDPVPSSVYPSQSDPMGDALRAPLMAAMLDLYAQRLEWRVDAPYELSNLAVNRGWDFGNARNPPESVSHLRTALALDPALHVLVAHGLYDVVTPYFRTKMLLDTIEPSAGAGRVSLEVWPGGHMFFSRDGSRAAFRAAGERLYK